MSSTLRTTKATVAATATTVATRTVRVAGSRRPRAQTTGARVANWTAPRMSLTWPSEKPAIRTP